MGPNIWWDGTYPMLSKERNIPTYSISESIISSTNNPKFRSNVFVCWILPATYPSASDVSNQEPHTRSYHAENDCHGQDPPDCVCPRWVLIVSDSQRLVVNPGEDQDELQWTEKNTWRIDSTGTGLIAQISATPAISVQINAYGTPPGDITSLAKVWQQLLKYETKYTLV